jgi:hypothetical protein
MSVTRVRLLTERNGGVDAEYGRMRCVEVLRRQMGALVLQTQGRQTGKTANVDGRVVR